MPLLDIVTNVLTFVLATIAVVFTATIDVRPPSRPGPRAAHASTAPVVLILHDGFVVSAFGQRLAPGCEVEGPGLAVGRVAGGDYDWDALRTCAERIKAMTSDESEVQITAASDVPYETVIRTADALRSSEQGQPLFPEIAFGVPR